MKGSKSEIQRQQISNTKKNKGDILIIDDKTYIVMSSTIVRPGKHLVVAQLKINFQKR